MIHPILEYGDVIYDNASLSIGQSLENIQRQAAIACTGAYRHTKHKTLLSEVGWETLSSRRRQHKLCLFFKIFKHIYPGYLFRFLVFSANSGYNLRNNHVLIPRFSRLTISFHSFFPSTTREWNKLSHQIQNSISANSFKSRLRENTINPFYKLCTGKQGVWLSRLRMELSPLNAHRAKYCFIPNSICPACNTAPEMVQHYFLSCPTFNYARISLLSSLENDLGLDTQNHQKLLDTIFHGKHIAPYLHTVLLHHVCTYMSCTNRFI